jgi:hypothetical protein
MLKDKEKKKGDKKEHKEKHKTKENAKSDKKTKTKENEGDKTHPLKNPVEKKKPNIEKSESTDSLKDEDITAEGEIVIIISKFLLCSKSYEANHWYCFESLREATRCYYG